MPDLKQELEEKRRKLQELLRQRNKPSCASVSTEVDVRREAEIEDLEERIGELEKQLAGRAAG